MSFFLDLFVGRSLSQGLCSLLSEEPMDRIGDSSIPPSPFTFLKAELTEILEAANRASTSCCSILVNLSTKRPFGGGWGWDSIEKSELGWDMNVLWGSFFVPDLCFPFEWWLLALALSSLTRCEWARCWWGLWRWPSLLIVPLFVPPRLLWLELLLWWWCGTGESGGLPAQLDLESLFEEEFLCSAASELDMLSCFFHLVRRFWNQIFTCKDEEKLS